MFNFIKKKRKKDVEYDETVKEAPEKEKVYTRQRIDDDEELEQEFKFSDLKRKHFSVIFSAILLNIILKFLKFLQKYIKKVILQNIYIKILRYGLRM